LPEELRRQARPQFVAAVCLAAHYLLGARSHWYPYFRVLPALPLDDDGRVEQDGRKIGLGEIDTPLWWSDEEKAWLQGTNLAKGVNDLDAAWNEEWSQWERVVLGWAEQQGLAMTW